MMPGEAQSAMRLRPKEELERKITPLVLKYTLELAKMVKLFSITINLNGLVNIFPGVKSYLSLWGFRKN